jgi:ubiquinone/menaquinone biosynthesis C-methylase UbiE
MRLNLGCGDILLQGFVNIDIKNIGGVAELDIREELPYLDDSIEGITISHTLSSIAEVHYPSMFRDFYRILEDGGVIRITDDNHNQSIERFAELNFNAPEFKGRTSPTVMRKYLKNAGFEVFDVTFNETHFKNKSLIQVNHGRTDKEIYFHIEGVKNGKSKE